MKFICLTLFVVCLLPAAFAKPSEDEVSQLERADPWWSALRAEAYYRQCQSSCTEHSRGVATTVELCDDTEVCRGRKNTLDEFATSRCTLWSKSLSGVTLVGPGRRFKQEPSIGSWISCAIFCETDKKQWYSPRRELGTEAFYPDGIWCHRDSKDADYYCQKNLCLPQQYEVNEAARMAADAEKEMSGEDNFIIDEAEGVVTIVSYNADIAP